jgi:hypothetical protein
MAAVVVVGALAPPAAAHTNDKLTYLTFTAPVQIPGEILDPGTYRFHLTNPETSRNVIQVLSHNGETVYAMFHTIPAFRAEVTEEAAVTFKEVAAGVPQPIHSLFYGGEHFGYEFLYPSYGWATFADEKPQPRVMYYKTPEPVTPTAMPEPAPIVNEPAAPESIVEAAEPPSPAPELPKTAGMLPMTAAAGMASLLLAASLALVRRRAG